jgi:hypothetical protein
MMILDYEERVLDNLLLQHLKQTTCGVLFSL